MRKGTRRQRLLVIALWGTLVATIGISWVSGCGYTCAPTRDETVTLPDGEFAPALGAVRDDGVGEPLLSGTFPHGAFAEEATGSAEEDGQQDGAAGASADSTSQAANRQIPSARLTVDRAGGTVTRSYLDAQGRSVVETWRFKGEVP